MNWLWLTIIGGFVGLDGTSFPQSMISRPLVAGALAGWAAGIPAEGALLGALLEAFHLAILPIGAARYPESGTATVAATFAFAWADAGGGSSVTLLLALVLALVWERVGGASVNALRRLNESIVVLGGARSSPGVVEARHYAAMAADFARGGLVTIAGTGIGILWLAGLAPLWAHGPGPAQGAVAAAAAGAAAAALRVFGGWSQHWKIFLAGVGAGMLLAWIR